MNQFINVEASPFYPFFHEPSHLLLQRPLLLQILLPEEVRGYCYRDHANANGESGLTLHLHGIIPGHVVELARLRRFFPLISVLFM